MPDNPIQSALIAIETFRESIGRMGLEYENPRANLNCPFDVEEEAKPPREIVRVFGPCDTGGKQV